MIPILLLIGFEVGLATSSRRFIRFLAPVVLASAVLWPVVALDSERALGAAIGAAIFAVVNVVVGAGFGLVVRRLVVLVLRLASR